MIKHCVKWTKNRKLKMQFLYINDTLSSVNNTFNAQSVFEKTSVRTVCNS